MSKLVLELVRTTLWHGSWRKCSLYDIVTNAHIVDIIPVIMAGIIGIYGLVVSVLVSSGLHQILPLYTGFLQLGAGLSVGLAGLAAGKTPYPPVRSPSWFLICFQDSPSVLSVMLVSVALPSSRDSLSE